MLRHSGRFMASLAAGLALLLGGCGGGSDEVTGDMAAADPAPPPAVASAEPAPPPPGNSEVPAPEAPGSAPAAPASGLTATDDAPAPASATPAPPPATLAQAPAAPVVAPAAPVSAESGRRVENAAATDDLLQLAQAAITTPVSTAGQPAGAASSSSGDPGMPGDSSAAMAAGYGAPAYGPDYGPPKDEGSRSEAAMRQGYQSSTAGAMPGEPMPGAPGSGIDSGYPGAEGSGLGGADSNEPDYSDAVKGAQTFLAAVRSKDVERIADAVALRSVSPEEGSARYKKTFQAILDRSVEPQVMDEIYEAFKEMKVVGSNNIKSSGSRGIIVGHQSDKQEYITRTLTMRREKAGWKVLDISGIRVQRMATTNRNRN